MTGATPEGIVVVIFFPIIFLLSNLLMLEILSLVYFKFVVYELIEEKVKIKVSQQVDAISPRYKKEMGKKLEVLKMHLYLISLIEIVMLYLYIYIDEWYVLFLLFFLFLLMNLTSLINARKIIIYNAFERKLEISDNSFIGLIQLILNGI